MLPGHCGCRCCCLFQDFQPNELRDQRPERQPVHQAPCLHHSEEHVAVPAAVLDGVGSVARDLERAVHAPETLLCSPIGEHEVGKIIRLKYV